MSIKLQSPRVILTTIIIVLYSVVINASGLNGVYTINKNISSKTNFKSFRAATKALKDSGINGAVIFNVADGHYVESVQIDSIVGSSAINTITFQSKSLDSTKVILDTAWVAAYPLRSQTILLNNCKYVIIRKMTIANHDDGFSGNGYNDVIGLNKNASHNTIESNILYYSDSGHYNYGDIIYNNDSTIEDFNTIKNNHITGAFTGINFYGYPLEFGNVIVGNTIDSTSEMGIQAEYQDSLYISSNKIFLPSDKYGIYLSNIPDAKKGHNDYSYVLNNFITVLGDNVFGMKNYEIDFLYVYNNTMYVASPSGNALYQDPSISSNAMYLYNNVLINDSAGPVFSFLNNVNSDYNDFYSLDNDYGFWNYSACTSLSDIQLFSGKNKNSFVGNPKLKDPSIGDLHGTDSSNLINNKGKPLSVISLDIDGELRSATHPDIGADEFTGDTTKVGIENEIKIYSENLSIFPNPAQSSITLKGFGFKPGRAELYCRDILGRTIFSHTIQAANDGTLQNIIDISMLLQGIYQIEIWQGNFEQEKKLMVR